VTVECLLDAETQRKKVHLSEVWEVFRNLYELSESVVLLQLFELLYWLKENLARSLSVAWLLKEVLLHLNIAFFGLIFGLYKRHIENAG